MNPFEDLIPNQQTGQNPFSDLVVQQKPTVGQKILNIGTKITDVLGGKAVAETFGAEIAKLGATPQERQFISQPTLGQTAGSAIQLGATFLPVGGGAKAITTGARALGLKTGASALGKIGSGALVGEVFDIGANLQEGKTGIEAIKPGLGTAIGAGIPAVGVGLNVAGRAARTIVPKLLSYTSDVPEKAFETMIQRRQAVVPRLGQATPETALKNTQGAVRELRGILTKDWQDGVVGLADEFKGKRLGLSEKSVAKITDLADNFGFTIPQNPRNASVVEWVNTLKSINELPRLTLTVSPKGSAVRALQKDLKNVVIKSFGGEKGSVANLYKNYSAKKGVFDAANDIVKAYSTGKPIQQSTALNRLQTLFNENKPAYFEAILDLEKATGRDLISEITASKFAQKLPLGASPVSATTGILAPTGILDKTIKLLLSPLSSPRSAGAIARVLGRGKNLGAIQGPGDVILGTELGQSAKTALSDFAKNPKLGMSIKAVKNLPEPANIAKKMTAGEYKAIADYIYESEVLNKTSLSTFVKADNVLEKYGVEKFKVSKSLKTALKQKSVFPNEWTKLEYLKSLRDFFDNPKESKFIQDTATGKMLGSKKTNPTVGKTAVGETPLIQEAKKYKSAEEFVKRIQGSATQYGDYFPKLRKYGMGDYKNITELGVNPDEMVTIYRGIDDITGKIPKKINDGDFVTTDYESAWAYAGDNKVVSKQVPAKTLYTDAIDDFKNDPFYTGSEYVYTKEKVTPMSESQLTDIWNKANKK